MISSKRINIIALLLTALVLVFVVYAMFLPQNSITDSATGAIAYSDLHTITITDDDYYSDYSGAETIILDGATAVSDSVNVGIVDGNVTILGGGTYLLSGTLDDGSLIVNSADDAEVRLILDGVSITSSDFSAIYIMNAAKTVISLVPGTENTLTDGSDYDDSKQDTGKPSAALYSKDSVTINGSGSLTVNGNYQDGIKVNDILRVTEGTLTVNANEDGINVNDYIVMLDVPVTVNSGGDGIKCSHEDDDMGFIVLEGTTLTVTSGSDGVSASSALYINNVSAEITSGGGSEESSSSSGAPSGDMGGDRGMGGGMRGGGIMSPVGGNQTVTESVSAKSIKAGTDLLISGGSFILDSSEDTIHSDGDVTIDGGTFEISAGDDAVHADVNLVISPDSMNITECYEGLEGAYITINGGEISIVSSDDGINASGEGTSSFGMRMGGSEEKSDGDDFWLIVNGGNIVIETSGDGFDSNGSAMLNGGTLKIYGPEDSGNGSIDVGDGGYALIINGGSLLAAGSSGMAENPSSSSPQCSIAFYLDDTYSAGSTIVLTDSSGTEIISGTSTKKFNWICVSDDTLTQGETYTLTIDGVETASVTIEDSTLATYGSSGGMSGNGGGMGGGRR
ncbi:MAG: carbohydrate-binding domain-containing protein [Oscillospiraceae bacterium]|nr:carbohydrate-binding domain-containing protein [Oscillospiraceae bacterium]